VEKYDTARQATYDNIIQRMRFACWITKATDTLRMCNTYCFSTATTVTRTLLNVTLYVHCLSCFFIGFRRIRVNRQERIRGASYLSECVGADSCRLVYTVFKRTCVSLFFLYVGDASFLFLSSNPNPPLTSGSFQIHNRNHAIPFFSYILQQALKWNSVITS
jgi:hypothetical protein